MRQRIEEDRAALAQAGRSAANLDFLDDQYRDSQVELPAIIDALRTALPPSARVYAPAALGVQPDHLAVRQAALSLSGEIAKLSLYADLPHASARGWPPWVTNGTASAPTVEHEWAASLAATGIRPDTMRANVYPLAGGEYARKLGAVRAYASQLHALEQHFRRSLADPTLLGYEVEWELPADNH